MRRFVQAFAAFVQRGGGQHADGAGEHGGLVAQNVAENVAGGDYVKLFGRAHELHGGVVHIHVRKLHVGIIFGHFVEDFFPQFGGFQYVGLVHAAQFFAALLRRFEGDFGNAADFGFTVFHGVVAFAFAVFQRADATRFAEVDVAREFAHDEDIQSGHHFGFERGSVG